MLAELPQQNALMIAPQAPAIPNITTIDSSYRLAELASKSGLCKTRNAPDAFFIIMYGMELGMSPMLSLRGIHLIQGVPVCSGEMMLALLRRSGKVEIKITGSATEATVWMKRKESGEEYTAHWTLERGRIAGLLKDGAQGNWNKYPQQMMQWRGVSECGKFIGSDILMNLYLFEEIAPQMAVNEAGEPMEGQTITITTPPPVERQPEAPRMASCLSSSEECRKQFAILCKELDLTNDEPYLKHLGNLKKYSDFPGTFDELVQKMRELHEWFCNEGHRVGEDEQTDIDPVAEASAQISVPQAAATLGSGGDRRITAPAVPADEHVITAPDSPFAAVRIEAKDAKPAEAAFVQPPF